jgi:hypothetical protein
MEHDDEFIIMDSTIISSPPKEPRTVKPLKPLPQDATYEQTVEFMDQYDFNERAAGRDPTLQSNNGVFTIKGDDSPSFFERFVPKWLQNKMKQWNL